MAPVPTAAKLTAYYAVDYRRGGRYGSADADPTEFPYDNLFYFNRGESVAELLGPHLGGVAPGRAPRILDIGAGFGHTLHSLAMRYPRSERLAVEISGPCVDHLRSLGVTVFTTTPAELLATANERFDLIILSHVLEHLPEPFALLTLLRRSLSPGGLLFVEVPNIPPDSLTRYPDHGWSPRMDEPHITFFSRQTLRAALERQGWTVLFCDTAGPTYDFVSWLRFHVPRLRPLVRNLLPKGLRAFLRRQAFTGRLRVREREASFYEYGRCSLWIRSVSTPSDESEGRS